MGAQAAGSIAGGYMSSRFTKQAAQLEQQQIGLRLQQEVLASNQQSIFNLRQLEETLASQRAMSAARGAMPGMGSALAIERKSIRAYKKDEQARALSLGFLKTQRKSQISMSKMGVHGAKAKFGLSTALMGAKVGESAMLYHKYGGGKSGGGNGGMLTMRRSGGY